MKLLKILTIVLLSLFLSFSVSFAQETNTADTGANNLQHNTNNGNVPDVDVEKNVSTEKTAADTVKPDTSAKKKNSISDNKTESKKNGNKKTSEKKAAEETVIVKEESTPAVKVDGDFLLINEGNFKYKRIPGIKLADIKPEAADSGVQVAEVSKPGENTSTGFLGLSKTASDVIVKGGVLLLILLIFILYKSRMSHPGTKSSKKRNVLNSYRK